MEDSPVEFVLGIAAGDTSEAAAAEWLRDRIEPDHERTSES